VSEQVFRLPDLGEGLTEAEVLDWHVRVGDTVTVDQIVVEVETAKAAVDVPVPFAGTVLRLHAEAGTAVAVGSPLITVGAPIEAASNGAGSNGAGSNGAGSGGAGSGGAGLGGAGSGGAGSGGAGSGGAGSGGAGSDRVALERYREEEQAGSGNVLIGYGTGAEAGSRRRRAGPVTPTVVPARRPAAAAPLVISPLVRRLARDHGIDLARVVATGPGGVTRRRDVIDLIDRADRIPAPTDGGDVVRIPLRGLRRAVAEKLTRSRAEIPDATTWVDADATALVQARDELRAAGRSIGLLALLARICVAGLKRFPALNATVDTERGEIVQFPYVHLGFAAQTERGLMVPVVRDAHRLTTAQLAAGLAELTELSRTGGLAPQHLAGGTFTLNNYGVFGVDGSTPIINYPEAALLGVGRIVDKPWVVDGALAVRKVTQLSLTFDHRVCDGAVAGGFLRYVADCVERPLGLLADL
jgi:2-oxoisovalerate dehydrogenase E2 component (dihydrolipoyl transacylase)